VVVQRAGGCDLRWGRFLRLFPRTNAAVGSEKFRYNENCWRDAVWETIEPDSIGHNWEGVTPAAIWPSEAIDTA
jgi:hypothetical protein